MYNYYACIRTYMYMYIMYMQVVCSCEQSMPALLETSALQLATDSAHKFSGDVRVVRAACGVVGRLAEAGEEG